MDKDSQVELDAPIFDIDMEKWCERGSGYASVAEA
jgi:hypothetical protein